MLVCFEGIRALALLNGGLVELYFLSDEFAPWTDLKTDLQSTALLKQTSSQVVELATILMSKASIPNILKISFPNC